MKESLQYIVVQHEDCTTPGSTIQWLTQNELNYQIVRPDRGDDFPVVTPSLRVIICGGIPNVDQDDRFRWLKPEKLWIRELLEKEVPVLGLCLGAQLMADALGARVFKSKDWEYGWQPLTITNEFLQWMNTEQPAVRKIFQCHGYQFDLPRQVTSLGNSAPTPCQGFFKGKTIMAVQFHPEADQNWIDLCVKTSKPAGPYCEAVDQIANSTRANLDQNQEWYFSLLNRFFL